jgi:hypothetical protein
MREIRPRRVRTNAGEWFVPNRLHPPLAIFRIQHQLELGISANDSPFDHIQLIYTTFGCGGNPGEFDAGFRHTELGMTTGEQR